MQRIDNASAVSTRPTPGPLGTPGYFTNGNPAQAQEATIVDDWWANAVQEEILTVIEQAGLTPDKNRVDQLYEALNLLYQGMGDLDATYLTIAGWRQWSSPILTANTATAYTVNYARDPGPPADGLTHVIEFHIACGAQATLNVNNHGPKPIHYYSVNAWRPVPPGLLGPNQIQPVAYHSGTDAYRLMEWKDTTGDLIPTGRATMRAGTIQGLGQAVSRVDYAGLFAAYGTTYGAGNGSTTFNLPDLRARAILGTDEGAGRLGQITASGVAGTLGSVGGLEAVQYTITGNAPSQSVSGNAYVSGTAYINGAGVHVWGATGDDPGLVWVSGNTIQAAVHPHQHSVDIYGNVYGNATCDGSGWITGYTGGGAITGTSDMRTNLPPCFVAKHAIAL